MTNFSHEALRFCKMAVDELLTTSFDDEKWKYRWVSVVALLRTVLHVYIKIDTPHNKSNSEYKEYWSNKKKEDIFCNFIERERNLVIKEFDFKNVSKVNFILTTENEMELEAESGDAFLTENIVIVKDFNIPVSELLYSALNWLEEYLCEMNIKFP